MNPDVVIAAAAVGVPILAAAWAGIRLGFRVVNLLERHDARLSELERIVDRRRLYVESRGTLA